MKSMKTCLITCDHFFSNDLWIASYGRWAGDDHPYH